jgi:hypothetical protein
MAAGISSRRRYTSAEISSVYQEISGTTDIATLFWIGSAVEFAFHKDVDWLLFSQGLLQDPDRPFAPMPLSSRFIAYLIHTYLDAYGTGFIASASGLRPSSSSYA